MGTPKDIDPFVVNKTDMTFDDLIPAQRNRVNDASPCIIIGTFTMGKIDLLRNTFLKRFNYMTFAL